MEDLLDGTVIPLSELFVKLELLHVNGEGGAIGEVDAGCMKNSFTREVEGTGRVAMSERVLANEIIRIQVSMRIEVAQRR